MENLLTRIFISITYAYMSLKPLFLCFFSLFLLASCNKGKKKPLSQDEDKPVLGKQAPALDKQKLKKKAAALRSFARANRYNSRYALLIDFSVFSGNKRFVLYNLEEDKIVSSSLVAHGQGHNYLSEKVEFSNVNGSRCSSPGRYKIGAKYDGRFGDAYKLHGLSATNSNAFSRFVVLHAHSCVPQSENSLGICRSDGCPTLNPEYFERVQAILDKEKQPVLLEIYQ